uniref:Major facilitator superfamily (MFS) profile domain-containing protein n=1 Tax=Globisporangium ultimum (strain ATCC 200006 / CBS 805.95 / DAOM BR144) TaxID=431595 RepID=K3W6E4_GLOUD
MLMRWWSRIAHNVQTAYVFTLFYWAARSILFQQVISGYVFVLTNSNKPVGMVKGIQGISQLVFSFPAGYFADRTRRDTILKLSCAIGIVASVLTFYAVEASIMNLLYVTFALWGLFAALQSPAMEALFADSIPHGERSFPFMIKYNVSNLAMILGPAISILLFLYYGDSWHLEQLKPVLEFGTVLAVIASLLLLRFDDDLAYENIRAKEQHTEKEVEQPLLTPSVVRNELEIDYEYSDDEDDDRKKRKNATERSSLLTTQENGDMEEGYLARQDVRFLCFRTRHVPWLLFFSDFIISNGAGMTINFFPLFFMQEYGLTPIHISVLFISQPLLVMTLSFLTQRMSKSFGRMPIIVFTRCFSVLCLFCMAYAQPLALQVVLFLMRGGMMRCSQPLRRSILMDYVPKDIRARWNAMEGLSVFSWSGSAVVGGYIIDAYGYRTCFLITSLVYVCGLGLETFLLPLTKHAVEK